MKIDQMLLATRNRHKTQELWAMLEMLDIRMRDLNEFEQCPEVEETGATLEENALLKARAAYMCSGLPSVADDTGLEIYYLLNSPGLFSARYSGPAATYESNNRKVLQEMNQIPERKRGARFRCVIAFVSKDVEKILEGRVTGRIAFKPKGLNGFGYDPLFIPDGYSRTYAELEPEIKNKLSHRSKAVSRLITFLQFRQVRSAMKHILAFAAFLFPGVLLLSCDNSNPAVSHEGEFLLVDQNYYPELEGTTWQYRIDTSTATGTMLRDVARMTARVTSIQTIDSVTYSVQINETIGTGGTSIDTVFFRKSAEGLFLSSPTLQFLTIIPEIPGIGEFPKEYPILRTPLVARTTWPIIVFEFDQIPFFPIYYRVNATYLGLESVQTDFRNFRDCARVRIDLDARFPNPENPTDIFNPLIIKESASFWFSRPIGLVVADGSEAVVGLITGSLPLANTQRRMHIEILSLDIVQPADTCVIKE